MTRTVLTYSRFDLIVKAVAKGLVMAVAPARGTCISFIPRKLLELADVDVGAPVVLTVVKHVIDRLVESGLLEADMTRSKVRYRMCKTSPLWDLCKAGKVDEVEQTIMGVGL